MRSRNWFFNCIAVLIFWFWYAVWMKVDPAFSVALALVSPAAMKYLFFSRQAPGPAHPGDEPEID